jgi:hypothetical protein
MSYQALLESVRTGTLTEDQADTLERVLRAVNSAATVAATMPTEASEKDVWERCGVLNYVLSEWRQAINEPVATGGAR